MKKNKAEVDFDDEERDMIESFENSDVKIKPISEKEKKYWQQVAANSISERKKKALSLRLGERDIDRIKAKASKKGLPYQTLIASVIHKYA
ncbi:MAG: hypothetical protein AAB734_00755, partial [Patescibacteria group bacterium]